MRTLHPRSEPPRASGWRPWSWSRSLPTGPACAGSCTKAPPCAAACSPSPETGPGFERSLVVADGLWDAARPRRLAPVPHRVASVPRRPGSAAGWSCQRSGGPAPPSRPGWSACCWSPPSDDAVALSRCAALADAAGTVAVAARLRPRTPRRSPCSPCTPRPGAAAPVIVAPNPPEASPPGPRTWTGSPARCWCARLPARCAPRPTGRCWPSRSARSVPSTAAPRGGRRCRSRPARPRPWPPGTARPGRDRPGGLDLDGREGLAGGRPDLSEVTAPSASGRDRPAGGGRPGHALGRLDQLVCRRGIGAQLRDKRWPGSSTSRWCWTTGTCTAWPGRPGVRLLFTGPPGTGKSLAAEAWPQRPRPTCCGRRLPRRLQVDGRDREEPGRRLRRRRAHPGGAAPRRGGRAVRHPHRGQDAHDRYANLETPTSSSGWTASTAWPCWPPTCAGT